MNTDRIIEAAAYLPPDTAAALNEIRVAQTVIADELAQLAPGMLGDDEAHREGAREILSAAIVTLEGERSALAALIAEVTDLLARLSTPGQPWRVDGLGSCRISRSSARTRYDNTLILARLAGALADEVIDRETGEVPPVGVIVERAVTACAAATGVLAPSFAGWRKTAMVEHGIDVSRYVAESTPGRLKLVVE